MEAEDYARVQRILDEGEVFRSGDRIAIGFLEDEGRLWRAVVKVTEERSKTYLATLHRAQPDDLVRARDRLVKMDREGG